MFGNTLLSLTIVCLVFKYGKAAEFSREDQVNLLRSGKETFDAVKSVVKDETAASDVGAVLEIENTILLARNNLDLIKEITVLKSSNLKKSQCANVEVSTQKLITEGEERLQICLDDAINNIYNNSELVTTTIVEAMNQGDVLLDALNKCSQKPGLQLISCYKKLIATHVLPLKLILINALNVHKSSHLELISIKRKNYECVDEVLKDQQEKMNKILDDATKACVN